MSEIILSSSNEGETYRINRLERVRGYVCALADYYGNTTLLNKISELHDHEGSLTVTWKDAPTDGEKDFFNKAWESAIANETRESIEHTVLY